jgi:hypothetical protein
MQHSDPDPELEAGRDSDSDLGSDGGSVEQTERNNEGTHTVNTMVDGKTRMGAHRSRKRLTLPPSLVRSRLEKGDWT